MPVVALEPKEIPEAERPLSEEFRIAARAWVTAQKAYKLLDESKTGTLARMKHDVIHQQGEMPDAKAERLVKASDEWFAYINSLVDAEAEANLAKMRMRWVEIRFQEWISNDANARRERHMGRQAP